MDIFKVIILPILVIIGSFVIASFVTPLGVFVLEKSIDFVVVKLYKICGRTVESTVKHTDYKIGRVYIPKPIKNLGGLILLQKRQKNTCKENY